MNQENKIRILLFGGSNFMGLHFVEKIISENINITELFIINRGNMYWNGQFFKIIQNQENIHYFKADRNNSDELKKCLQQIKVLTGELLFDYICDFSCYMPKEMKLLLDLLDFNFKTFLYISTDSTYNASEISLTRDDKYFVENEPTAVEESEAYLPVEKTIRKILKERDSYGYYKLKAEEILKTYLVNKRDYIIIRLPDVLGSYDRSLSAPYRLWNYLTWLQYSNVKPIEFDKIDLIRRSSFVTKEEVAEVLMKIIYRSDSINIEDCLNQEFNLCSDINPTLKEFIDILAEKQNLSYNYIVKDYGSFKYFPSVTFGAISNEKARKCLKFIPKVENFFKSIETAIEFYDSAKLLFPTEYNEMKALLPEEVQQFLSI